MNRSLALRALAIVIAIAGIVDPSFMREQRVPPEIALVASDAAVSPALMQRVRSALGDDFSVIEGPFSGAAATVIVGVSLPDNVSGFASPTFAVVPTRRSPDVRIEAVRAPAFLSIDAAAAVEVDLDANGAAGDSVVVTLRHDSALVDRVARAVAGETSITVPVAFVPTKPGLAVLQASAEIVRGGTSVAPAVSSRGAARADFSLRVRDTRLRVLFHDARPSWMSTFVRRALERDPRMSITSRVVTSRGISTDAGRPRALASLGATSPFDVIVLGAPESLTGGDVEGLDAFLRERGGGVVFLLDGRAPGPYDRLMQIAGWTSGAESEAVALAPADSLSARSLSTMPGAVALRAAEWVAPRTLPAGATSVLRVAGRRGPARATASGENEESRGAPVVWRAGVGAGTLLVSGAVDSWRYRDSTQSGFTGFWSTIVAELGDAALPPITVTLVPAVVRPGAEVVVHAAVRGRWDPRSAADPVVVSAEIAPDGSVTAPSAGRSPIRLWPGRGPGSVDGRTRAPTVPGRYRVRVSADGPGLDSVRADAELVVADSVVVAGRTSVAMLSLWTRAHGGRRVPEASLSGLRAAITGSLTETRRTVPWYPMRSGWWIVPFALLLTAEWWIRRRRGLP